MNCVHCGKPIKSKAIEGADYIKDNSGNYWCMESAKLALTRWELFEKYEKLSENSGPLREALVSTLQWAITQGYCMEPERPCHPEPEKCLKCWLKYSIKEEVEG